MTATMLRALSSATLLIGATVACAPVDELYSGACWTTVNDGRVTMRCPDGSRASWLEPKGDGHCTIRTDAEGTRQIECPDGSSASVPPNLSQPPNAAACTLTDNGNAGFGLTCGDERYDIVRGCADGFLGYLDLSEFDRTPDASGEDAATSIYLSADCSVIHGGLRLEGGLTKWAGIAVVSDVESARTISIVRPKTDIVFSMLRSVPGVLEIVGGAGSENRTPVVAFPELERVEGTLRLVQVFGSDIDLKLPNLRSVGVLSLSDTQTTADLSNFSGLRDAKRVELVAIAGLQTLDGIEGVGSLSEGFAILNNEELSSLDALRLLTSVGGDIRILGNSSLPPCHAYALVEHLRENAGFVGEAELEDTVEDCGD